MPRSWARAYDFVGSFQIVTSGLSNSIAFSEGLIGTDSRSSKTYKDTMAWGIEVRHCRKSREKTATIRYERQYQRYAIRR